MQYSCKEFIKLSELCDVAMVDVGLGDVVLCDLTDATAADATARSAPESRRLIVDCGFGTVGVAFLTIPIVG